ncbi:TioE family transcriptional regulator [Streptomyces sp. Da 82-17]|uniref:TioE family transcriptional regulator n=1 Tax=Streptomyces sp. Da 82-17 TaxID=3377116 RepID=UPI0038D44DDD
MSGLGQQKSQTRVRLRPVDLAREHGLSTQAVRNYEEAGVLPPAERTASGHRTYTPLHASALRAFLALLPGHGHRTSASVMRAVNDGTEDEAYRLIDESHAQLLEDRRTLAAVENALRDLHTSTDHADPHRSTEPSTASEPGRAAASSFVGPLAHRLGVRPATLRKWERAGLVAPRRDPQTGYRVYDADAVRDARLVHQLRRGGYLLEQIAPLVEQVRAAGGRAPLEAALSDWHGRLAARGRAMLSGAGMLDTYLRERGERDEREGTNSRV